MNIRDMDTADIEIPKTWRNILRSPDMLEGGREVQLYLTSAVLALTHPDYARLYVDETMMHAEYDNGVALHHADGLKEFYHDAWLMRTPEFVDGACVGEVTEIVYNQKKVEVLELGSPREYSYSELHL